MDLGIRAVPLESGVLSSFRAHTVATIPTTFGRLVYLASFRDGNTGEYRHFALASQCSLDEADQAFRQWHNDAFADWLGFSLEGKKADLDLYLADLAGAEGNRPAILATWSNIKPYRNLVPLDSSGAERNLFFSDLETLISLFSHARGNGAGA